MGDALRQAGPMRELASATPHCGGLSSSLKTEPYLAQYSGMDIQPSQARQTQSTLQVTLLLARLTELAEGTVASGLVDALLLNRTLGP